MQLSTIQGTIDRRVLVNYHADPDCIQKILPPLFQPKIHRGFAIAGICLIRLKHLRPTWLPLRSGFGSENAAHRIAVEWEENGVLHEGVFIPRRDTNSRLNTLIGGRLFPGEHHHAVFTTHETADSISIDIRSADEQMHVGVRGSVADNLPADSVFTSLAEASDFFAAGSVGYSATSSGSRFDGLELRCKTWQMTPLAIEHVESSFYNNRELFPAGTIEFDCALLMRDIEHQWHSQHDLCCETAAAE